MKLTDYETKTGHRATRCGAKCTGCYYCAGDLFLCCLCGQAEAELEEQCPERGERRHET